ncbi:MAG: SDR family NAD(P)-dependent oxidoreductase, partial [Micromonosporaceae bacterium]|nr:SDR family NAD(P)-dependent oxidoreductase [Micromonosporaceae bacterium]
RRAHRLAEVAAGIRAAGGTATEAVVDVGDRTQVNAAVRSTVEAHGKLDIVVQSAGVGYMGPVLDAEIELWDEMIATNLVGVLNLTHAALPHLIANEVSDMVVVSSHSGRLTTMDNNVYAATKFGVNAFCDSLRMEVAEYGTRVMVIEPGMTRGTEITTARTAPHIRQAVEMFFATRPSLTPEDIANTIVHMVSQPGNVTLHEVLILPTATYGPPRQRPGTQSAAAAMAEEA